MSPVKHRVLAGLSSQEVVAEYLRAVARELGYRTRHVSSAAFGQKHNDVVLSVGGLKFGVEVKGTNGNKPISMFDKSVRRRSVPTEIDRIVAALVESISIGGANLGKLLSVNSYGKGFLDVMDFYRDKVDSTIGLAEDKNSTSSGKLPRDFITRDPAVCAAARRLILENLKSGGDTYFAVHDKNTDAVRYWYTGHGTNVLSAPRLPPLKEVGLDTYGGASMGATRIALKIRL
jgi:hypothetical protein